MAGFFAIGTKKWPHMGPWNMGKGLFRLVCLAALVGMVIIFYIAIQPPNDKVIYIVIAFFILAIAVWFGFENRRFMGPPIGEEIVRRQAVIKAAEAAVGEV